LFFAQLRLILKNCGDRVEKQRALQLPADLSPLPSATMQKMGAGFTAQASSLL
jgi:hypothetical protein